MLTHTLPRCVPMHTPGPTHRPRFDGGFVFHTMMTSSVLNSLGTRSSKNRVFDAVRVGHLSMSFHGGLTNLTRLLEASSRRCKVIDRIRAVDVVHWSSPQEDGVQSQTHAGEENNLNGWTIDSWPHYIPSPNAGAPQDCSESATTARARKSSC